MDVGVGGGWPRPGLNGSQTLRQMEAIFGHVGRAELLACKTRPHVCLQEAAPQPHVQGQMRRLSLFI